MGVYIKGMRMPKGCYDPLVAPSYCFMLNSGTCKICHEYADKHGELCMEYPQGCPLVEVKEPHGRLVDINGINELINRYNYKDFDHIDYYTPTIIERESG